MCFSKKPRTYKITTGINDADTFWETQAVKTWYCDSVWLLPSEGMVIKKIFYFALPGGRNMMISKPKQSVLFKLSNSLHI